MQKGFSLLFILITAGIVLTAAGGAYYLGKLPVKPAFREPKVCTQEAKLCPDGSSVGRTGPNCEFTPCPSASPAFSDETADWKTYVNNSYKISFKYPAEFFITEKQGETVIIFLTRSAEEKTDVEDCIKQTECYSYPLNIEFQVLPKSKNQSLEDVIKKDRHLDQLNMLPINIDGLSGLEDQLSGIGIVHNTYIDKGRSVLLIFANAINDAEMNMAIYKKILSTFKFLNNSEGEFCGGITGKECPFGYTCIMDGKYPDAGGKCAKE